MHSIALVRLMTNSNGSAVNEYSYGLFGKIVFSASKETPDCYGNITAEIPLKFNGHWYDKEVGQYTPCVI